MNNEPKQPQPQNTPTPPSPSLSPTQQKLLELTQKNEENLSAMRKKISEHDIKIKQYEDKRKENKEKVYRKNVYKQYTVEENQEIDVPVDGELEKGSRVFMMYCSACHNLDPNSKGQSLAPALGLIFNRKSGSDIEYSNYSPALSNSNIYWTPKNLYNFLLNPQKILKNTKCTIWNGTGLSSEQDRADLIVFLRQYTRELQKNIKLKEVKARGYSILQTEMYANQQMEKEQERRGK